jgi:acetyl-CoA acyltransferase
MIDAFVCDGVRTPFGRYAGALAAVRADDLAAWPIRALIDRHPQVDWSALDDVIYGCANQAGEDNRNVARMAALLARLPVEVPGATLNRLCGSGLDAVGTAARAIRAGEAELLVAGGVESMSRAPFVIGKADSGFARDLKLEDTTLGWRFVNPALRDLHGVDSMAQTAENVAGQFRIERAAQDEFALRSQERCARAQARGLFREEIAPVVVAGRRGPPVNVEQDEHPRADTTREGLAKLRGIVHDAGSVTAGNSSGVNDGACALLIASERAARAHGLAPRARIVAQAVAGVPPRIMGIGPVPAARKALARAGLALADMDVVELNEAFAAQALAVLRALGLPDDAAHVNPNGGAIALGHPLGASGARLVLTALRQLERSAGRYALCCMCIGVGQGIALILERIP